MLEIALALRHMHAMLLVHCGKEPEEFGRGPLQGKSGAARDLSVWSAIAEAPGGPVEAHGGSDACPGSFSSEAAQFQIHQPLPCTMHELEKGSSRSTNLGPRGFGLTGGDTQPCCGRPSADPGAAYILLIPLPDPQTSSPLTSCSRATCATHGVSAPRCVSPCRQSMSRP